MPYFTPALLALSVIGIVYGAWIAYAQRDLKRLVAYSSLSHMGFIALGVVAWTPVSLSGSVLQMVNHGITTGCLFILVAMLEDRSGGRDIGDFGGLWGRAPYFSLFFLLTALASVGLPGLNNFTGEFLILAGTFRVSPWAAALAFAGVVPILVYMLRAVQQVLFTEAHGDLVFREVSLAEGVILAAFAGLMIFLGVYPAVVLDLVRFPVHILAGGGP
jgi:NADH-quinone oxidoreductase subunit M